ncbi:MAG TPA: hypothetical protein VEV39_15825 [Gemmatimonadales bacterium]|nr:hypothetical protein [Gemmatimonadales bacterium]
MRSTWFTRGARAVLALVAVAVVAGVTPAAAKPKPGVKRTSSNLFALTAAIMQVNHQYCPVINTGNVCTDPSGNGVIEGGFWPKGTPDSYIFNSGLQIAGTVDAAAGIPWAGDTTGSFFMDPRGDQADGSPLTLVYNSLDAGDQAAWPSPEGFVTDTSIYASVLLTRPNVSQQDLWFRAWDGNPTRLGGRAHPMGILVDTRGMAWNFPTGNEDIIYFVYTFTNVTSSVTADYDNASAVNHDPTYLADLSALGAQFQSLNQTKYGFAFPQHGYAFDNVFAAFFEDCDVGTDHVAQNYSTPVFPFNMGVCYEAPFNEQSWTAAGSYNPSIFTGPTFFAGPGFTSVKYLKSPTDNSGKQLGLVMFSNTLNSATGYPDPVGVKQMYRYLSGGSSPAAGDNPCSFQGEQSALHYCYLAQVSQDTRFFESSGPFTLLPGQTKTIVVAYINAPAVNTPFLQTQVGGDFKPGFGATGDSIAKDSTKVREIERVMGWVTQKDTNNDGTIEQYEVSVVPRSLLSKASVAQAVFNAKFLLPFSPDAPQFFLIPGDNQVTVVWEKSHTENPVTGGDPYFAIANDPTNALYDPNFRRFDVEGYRIYRGRTPGALTLVAQFDYSGTEMIDYTGSFNWGNCAPELGINYLTAGNTCPKDVFGNPYRFDAASIAAGIGAPVPLVGNVVQIPAGGRAKLANGTALITAADTAVTGGGSGNPPLADNGVGFAYVDRSVRNLFQYFYSVTAFDINSVRSGPSSLESPRATKSVIPRAAGAVSAGAGQLGATVLLNGKGQPLGAGTAPTIDATTGEFSGPSQPTNTLSLGFPAFLPELVDSGTMTMTIDSVLPGQNPVDYGLSIATTYYITTQSSAGVSHIAINIQTDATVGEPSASGNFTGPKITHGTNYGGDTSFSLAGQVTLSVPGPWRLAGPGRGAANSNPAGSGFTGDRWWGGGAANENTADPTKGMCNASGGCSVLGGTSMTPAKLAQTAGSIPGVTIIGAIQAYNTTPNYPLRDMETSTSTVYRAADFALYWGTGGAIDSVVDLTHQVRVPFNSKLRASYGIIDSTSFVGVPDDVDGNPNVLTWGDVMCVDPLNATVAGQFGYGCANPVPMRDTAHLGQISTQFVADSTGASNQPLVSATQARGFILYLAGKFWAVAMPALPAAGTVWNARYFAGNVTGTTGTYKFVPADRPPAVPGLGAKASYTASLPLDLNHTSQDQLAAVHTVPDPYYVTNALEITPNNKVLKFVNLPPKAIVRIYSVSGILVQVLTHNDATGGGELEWDLRNRSNQFVASGVYFYHVESADGKTKVGRFTVVQFAP